MGPTVGPPTVAAKPLETLIFAIFFKRLDKNLRNFSSEHLRTTPNFHYLDIVLSHKYFRLHRYNFFHMTIGTGGPILI